VAYRVDQLHNRVRSQCDVRRAGGAHAYHRPDTCQWHPGYWRIALAVAGVLANVDTSWGAIAGGGFSTSSSTVVADAIGEPAIGTSASQSVIVEAGVLVLPLGDAQSSAGKQMLYLPQVVK
jgi:hypothetical protein